MWLSRLTTQKNSTKKIFFNKDFVDTEQIFLSQPQNRAPQIKYFHVKLIKILKTFIWLVHFRVSTLQTAVTHPIIRDYGLKQAHWLRQDRNYLFITFLTWNILFRNVSSTRREPTPISSVALPAVHSLHRLRYPVSFFFVSSQNIKLTKIHNKKFEHIPTWNYLRKLGAK